MSRLICWKAAILMLLGYASAADHLTPVEVAGLHNVFRITDTLYSGSGPEGEASFAALHRLGIKTIISVDGAKPQVALAKKYGLRYVHLPLGYGGVPPTRVTELAKAMKELPGPFYVHCHHGKHRGPTAAAVAQLCADETCTIDKALQVLRQAGTDPKYHGLFASVHKFRRPTAQELAAVGELPEVVQVAALTQAMVLLDIAWDHLKLVRAAGWKTPADHPDLVPRLEARQLAEHYQAMTRLADVKDRPADFQRWLTEGQATAEALEQLLRVSPIDAPAAEKAFAQLSAGCVQCHARYRDVPLP